MRKYIPYPLRLFLKLRLRSWSDRRKGIKRIFAKPQQIAISLPYQFELAQPVFQSNLFENKIHNLKIAANRISMYTIEPGQIFSFWNMVGKPSFANGYKKGRNLIAGKLNESEGGGLCQLSGIIYHTALINGFEILERHSHSIDIYTEENRFTPLGADATIVYGYKDLRIKNNTRHTVRFDFIVEKTRLICILHASDKIIPQQIIFDRINDNTVITKLFENGIEKELERSFYLK